MIAVRLMGGLGNQMFQYAAGRRLAARHGAELVLDLGWFSHEAAHVETPREYELHRFPIRASTASFSPRQIASRLRRPRVTVLRQADDDHRLDRRVLEAPDGVLLIGYWQSEGYFADCAEAIRAELAFDVEPVPAFADLDATASGAVALHVRRGDYVMSAATSAYHGVLGVDYYRRALELVEERAGAGTGSVLVFCDDPAWAAAELDLGRPATVVPGGDVYQDLRLMTRCTHFVVANSSFSWWGAWLGESGRSVVVAPARWFADERRDTSDVVPARWIRT